MLRRRDRGAACDEPGSIARFRNAAAAKKIPDVLDAHRSGTETFAYLTPRPTDKAGNATVAIVNRKLSLGVAIHYRTNEFPAAATGSTSAPAST